MLEQAGVVHRVVATDEFTRYELAEDLTEHHHHLICSSCGAVADFTIGPAARGLDGRGLRPGRRRPPGSRPSTTASTWSGRCADLPLTRPTVARRPGRHRRYGDAHDRDPRVHRARASRASATRSRPTSTTGSEVGAAFCAYHRGEKVVDLWGGVADPETGAPWDEDTIILVFSTTKGATALCANRLAERGRLDVDAPVAELLARVRRRPARTTSRCSYLLSHQAGLAWIDGDMTLEEALAWEPVDRARWRARPPLGAGHRSTATTPPPTAGWSARSSGASPARASARSSATRSPSPLGLDFWIGLPEARGAAGRAAHHDPRAARPTRPRRRPR